MKPFEKLYLVMYDITHKKSLQKIAKVLQKEGFVRINYSVWLGWESPISNRQLNQKITHLLGVAKARGSRLYILPLTLNLVKKIKTSNGAKPKDLDYWVGEKQLLII